MSQDNMMPGDKSGSGEDQEPTDEEIEREGDAVDGERSHERIKQ